MLRCSATRAMTRTLHEPWPRPKRPPSARDPPSQSAAPPENRRVNQPETVSEPALARAGFVDAQVRRYGRADVRKRFAPADRAGRDGRPEGEDRRMLARVVGPAPGRVVAVVGRDDGEVAGF